MQRRQVNQNRRQQGNKKPTRRAKYNQEIEYLPLELVTLFIREIPSSQLRQFFDSIQNKTFTDNVITFQKRYNLHYNCYHTSNNYSNIIHMKLKCSTKKDILLMIMLAQDLITSINNNLRPEEREEKNYKDISKDFNFSGFKEVFSFITVIANQADFTKQTKQVQPTSKVQEIEFIINQMKPQINPRQNQQQLNPLSLLGIGSQQQKSEQTYKSYQQTSSDESSNNRKTEETKMDIENQKPIQENVTQTVYETVDMFFILKDRYRLRSKNQNQRINHKDLKNFQQSMVNILKNNCIQEDYSSKVKNDIIRNCDKYFDNHLISLDHATDFLFQLGNFLDENLTSKNQDVYDLGKKLWSQNLSFQSVSNEANLYRMIHHFDKTNLISTTQNLNTFLQIIHSLPVNESEIRSILQFSMSYYNKVSVFQNKISGTLGFNNLQMPKESQISQLHQKIEHQFKNDFQQLQKGQNLFLKLAVNRNQFADLTRKQYQPLQQKINSIPLQDQQNLQKGNANSENLNPEQEIKNINQQNNGGLRKSQQSLLTSQTNKNYQKKSSLLLSAFLGNNPKKYIDNVQARILTDDLKMQNDKYLKNIIGRDKATTIMIKSFEQQVKDYYCQQLLELTFMAFYKVSNSRNLLETLNKDLNKTKLKIDLLKQRQNQNNLIKSEKEVLEKLLTRKPKLEEIIRRIKLLQQEKKYLYRTYPFWLVYLQKCCGYQRKEINEMKLYLKKIAQKVKRKFNFKRKAQWGYSFSPCKKQNIGDSQFSTINSFSEEDNKYAKEAEKWNSQVDYIFNKIYQSKFHNKILTPAMLGLDQLSQMELAININFKLSIFNYLQDQDIKIDLKKASKKYQNESNQAYHIMKQDNPQLNELIEKVILSYLGSIGRFRIRSKNREVLKAQKLVASIVQNILMPVLYQQGDLVNLFNDRVKNYKCKSSEELRNKSFQSFSKYFPDYGKQQSNWLIQEKTLLLNNSSIMMHSKNDNIKKTVFISGPGGLGKSQIGNIFGSIFSHNFLLWTFKEKFQNASKLWEPLLVILYNEFKTTKNHTINDFKRQTDPQFDIPVKGKDSLQVSNNPLQIQTSNFPFIETMNLKIGCDLGENRSGSDAIFRRASSFEFSGKSQAQMITQINKDKKMKKQKSPFQINSQLWIREMNNLSKNEIQDQIEELKDLLEKCDQLINFIGTKEDDSVQTKFEEEVFKLLSDPHRRFKKDIRTNIPQSYAWYLQDYRTPLIKVENLEFAQFEVQRSGLNHVSNQETYNHIVLGMQGGDRIKQPFQNSYFNQSQDSVDEVSFD